MLKILKASAGSGKTFNLAREYIRLIVKSDQPDAYRHVLAVTFTNKATDEMKRRILKELHLLASDPDSSKYLGFLKEETGLDKTTIQKRAQTQLSGILHDYSAFAVSTIDHFFQQTLRAFSREIGQFSAYQVHLDRDELVQESVDRVLDGVSEDDTDILDWLAKGAKSDLADSGRVRIESRLREMAASLGKLPEEGRSLFSREKLKELRDTCISVRKAWETEVMKSAQRVIDTVTGCGLTTDIFNGKFLNAVYKYQKVGNNTEALTAPFIRKARNPEEWFSKANAPKFMPKVRGMLEAPLEEFVALFDRPFKVYNTARLISGQIYAMGMASELAAAFQAIQKEKNVISIDDSNTILKGIIDGTDTPFIYEKLGVRFDDFLLDEFQDTSDVQWDNFRPLVHGSVDQGADSLVVGDVKQSIYRFRGSDWNLLGSRLEEEFSNPVLEPLKENWRTCREIVHFNNEFFDFAASQLDVQDIYADVTQIPKFDNPAPGSVDVVFTDDEMGEVLSTIDTLRDAGAEWADIAILVRNNSEGSLIASELVAREIPVVSDDSLFMKSSATVRRLVAELSLVAAPQNPEMPSVAGYLASTLSIDIPQRYHSLPDLAENLLRELRDAKPDVFDAEVPYIQSFMDYLQDWVNQNGNNLQAFLKAWEGVNPQIASPASGDAVRIMTIHKAKGLEFPYVIFPYAEKVGLYRESSYWRSPDTRETSLEGKVEGDYYVQLSSTSSDTLFWKDYEDERRMQAVDNINIFYVALTRPIYGLKVIAKPLPQNYTGPKNMSHVLYLFTKSTQYSRGELFNFKEMERKEAESALIVSGYPSFPAESGSRLKFSKEAADYFGPDGTVGPEASRRIRGNVLHNILSMVRVPEDLPSAVRAAVLSGELPESLSEEALEFLKERIASVAGRGWFSSRAQIRLEETVISTDGEAPRPDRVVIHPDGKVDVVDYKFGKEESKYLTQVREYVDLYRRMGFEKVEGYLWYLADNLINFVADKN
ncbi:MAG: UvrD-helicase domain-containing protein [Bacteroidales bacterium]|nr:UvrD-helicase domain-containing protein [Bacteroidales bacterium]